MLTIYVENKKEPAKVDRKGESDLKLVIENFSITGSKDELKKIAKMIYKAASDVEKEQATKLKR